MATRKKKQTLAEFRAWLSGVEELQPDDWAPNATQWRLIRDKINNVIEPKAAMDEATIQKLLAGINKPANNFGAPPQHGNPYPVGGGVPVGDVVDTQTHAKEQPVILKSAPEIDIAGAAKPNLDTSDGNYNSGFS